MKSQIRRLLCSQHPLSQPGAINALKSGNAIAALPCRSRRWFKRQARNWRDKVKISQKYSTYRDDFIEMLIKFQSIWDSDIGRISVSNHCIKFSNDNTKPVHPACYLAGPTTREFAKSEIEKMLAKNITEPVQTEWSAPILFAPRKMEDCAFAWIIVSSTQ